MARRGGFRAFGVLICAALFSGCASSPDLTGRLRSRNAYIQYHAINRVISEGRAGKRILRALSGCVDSPVPSVSVKAAEALGRLGDKGVPVLAGKLRHSRPEVKWKAARGLGYAGREARAAEEELISSLEDENPLVRQYAALTIGRAGIKDAVDQLRERAEKDEDPRVKRAARTSLAMLGAL